MTEESRERKPGRVRRATKGGAAKRARVKAVDERRQEALAAVEEERAAVDAAVEVERVGEVAGAVHTRAKRKRQRAADVAVADAPVEVEVLVAEEVPPTPRRRSRRRPPGTPRVVEEWSGGTATLSPFLRAWLEENGVPLGEVKVLGPNTVLCLDHRPDRAARVAARVGQ